MNRLWYFALAIPIALGIIVSRGELRETHLPASVRTSAELAAFIDSVVPRWMSRYRIPGLCVGIVEGDARVLRCYGKTASEGGRSIDGTSRFAVASISKTFAALAVLTLAAQDLIDLDAPVERYLGTWRFPKSGYDSSAVTARRLLSHTAGTGVGSYGGVTSAEAGESTRDVLDGRGSIKVPVTLIRAPGSGFRYSGGGYMVLQLLIEEVSGMPFERYVVENVFQPMGMRDSTFSWKTIRDADARGHDVAGRILPLHTYGAAMAPGGMVTTGNDMLGFLTSFADPHVGTLLGWQEGMWKKYLVPVNGFSGMGIMITESNGHMLIGHGGTTMGYNAGFTVSPSEGFGWFVLANGNGGVFLESDLDPLFQEWKTGYRDPQYGILKVERCVTAFLAVVVPGFGIFFLAVFAASLASRKRRWIGKTSIPPVLKILRLSLVPIFASAFVLWTAFFHTDLFYPAYTTAWLPFSFQCVTLGVATVALRLALGCAFPAPRRRACPLNGGVVK